MKRQKNHGFTLVELLVVIAIIALLLSILMPSLNRARHQAKQIVCLSTTKQIGQVLVLYAMDNKDTGPLGRYGGFDTRITGWYSRFTPYLDPSVKVPAPDAEMGSASDPLDYLFGTPGLLAEQVKYNRIWNKMICPAETLRLPVQVITAGGGVASNGVNMLTYGYHYAYYPEYSYEEGYGLIDWSGAPAGARLKPELRKLSSVRRASEMLAFTDTRGCDYMMAGFYAGVKSWATKSVLDWYFPDRHPGGYMTTFVDGHSSAVERKIIEDDKLKYVETSLWKAL